MRGAWLVMGWLACASFLAPAAARADRSFAIRYTTNDLGSITFAANTLMTCPDSAPTCVNARDGAEGGALGNNNGYAMAYVDVDGSGNGTFDSSTATLSLPPDAFVLFAGLYWAGDTSAGQAGERDRDRRLGDRRPGRPVAGRADGSQRGEHRLRAG